MKKKNSVKNRTEKAKIRSVVEIRGVKVYYHDKPQKAVVWCGPNDWREHKLC